MSKEINLENLTDKQSRVIELAKKSVTFTDIVRETGISKGYVSKILKAWEEFQEDSIKDLYYFEFPDHVLVENSDLEKENPILSVVGFIEAETDDALSVKQIWNKTTGNVIRKFMVIKSPNLKKIKYTRSNEQGEKNIGEALNNVFFEFFNKIEGIVLYNGSMDDIKNQVDETRKKIGVIK